MQDILTITRQKITYCLPRKFSVPFSTFLKRHSLHVRQKRPCLHRQEKNSHTCTTQGNVMTQQKMKRNGRCSRSEPTVEPIGMDSFTLFLGKRKMKQRNVQQNRTNCGAKQNGQFYAVFMKTLSLCNANGMVHFTPFLWKCCCRATQMERTILKIGFQRIPYKAQNEDKLISAFTKSRQSHVQ